MTRASHRGLGRYGELLSGQLNLEISELLRRFKAIREKARNTFSGKIQECLRFDFPKTNELGFMEFFDPESQGGARL